MVSKFRSGLLIALFCMCAFCGYAYTYTSITLDNLTYSKRSDQNFSKLDGSTSKLIVEAKIQDMACGCYVTHIGGYAFDRCTLLKSVTFPVKLRVIGALAFANCGSIRTISFPSEMISIGNYAFRGCI